MTSEQECPHGRDKRFCFDCLKDEKIRKARRREPKRCPHGYLLSSVREDRCGSCIREKARRRQKGAKKAAATRRSRRRSLTSEQKNAEKIRRAELNVSDAVDDIVSATKRL